MKRCKHIWDPLIRSKVPLDRVEQVTFTIRANGIQHYDRCRLCGRLAHINRFRKRKTLSCDTTNLIHLAARFDEWWEKERNKGEDK